VRVDGGGEGADGGQRAQHGALLQAVAGEMNI
jgi:hypothetical protein